jgi:hypothetical protein
LMTDCVTSMKVCLKRIISQDSLVSSAKIFPMVFMRSCTRFV